MLNEDINDLESESEGEEDDDDGWDRGDNLDERKTDVSNASIPELSKMQTLLVSGLVYGYGLRESKWGKSTCHLKDHLYFSDNFQVRLP